MSGDLLGLLGEFGDEDSLLEAAKGARAEGFRCIDAFSPFPVEGMADLLELRGDRRIGWITIAGGITGFVGLLLVELFVNADYPIEVGGRPLIALPAFFVVDFELMILFAVLFAVIGMFAIIGLPKLYHPLFGTPRFSLASDTRFFLYIDAKDRKFDAERTRAFLGSLGAWTVQPVRA
jgi:Protein of unknown function (DUF3341)